MLQRVRSPESVLTALRAQFPALEAQTADALSARLALLVSRHEVIDAVSFAEAIWRRGRDREGLLALKLDDLLLAEACLDGDAAALRELDALLERTTRALGRRATGSEQDELQQQLRIRLLVAQGDSGPKLAHYGARGPLAGYVRVVAVNLLNTAQAPRPPASDSGLVALPDALDWESGVLRVDQQHHFREAFRKAVAGLTVRQRALLRLNLLDGLTIDELAPLYGSHRSSVARWLADAKSTLEAETRRLTAELLKLEPAEVDRLLAGAQQGFELSLARALRESVISPG